MNKKNKIIFSKHGVTGFIIDSEKHGPHSVIVDTSVISIIEGYMWSVSYRRGRIKCICGHNKGEVIPLHKLITGHAMTDHMNGNVCDNRKSNLRECNNHQNLCNRGPNRNNTSGFKGVCRDRKRWIAQIKAHGERISLGTYDSPGEAAIAYNKAAIKYHGEFARLNEIGESHERN